jgi:hypothetical protein
MARTFVACKQKVHNRGKPPDSFLDELIDWGRTAPDEIFERNPNTDVYSLTVGTLGPWRDLAHRRAAMLEVLRVLGGFESSWKWEAGVDVTNPSSNTPETEEAGIFQCSCNSMAFDPSLKELLRQAAEDTKCKTFIEVTKANHPFALEYCARLLRFTIKHHGPLKRAEVLPFLSRDAAAEIESFLN